MLEQFISLLKSQTSIEPIHRSSPLIVEEAFIDPPFYVHFDERDLRIKSISSCSVPDEGQRVIEIDHALGIKFMLGEENTISWVIGSQDDKYVIKKTERQSVFIGNRIDILHGVVEVTSKNQDHDVLLELDRENNLVLIHYDGEKIQQLPYPMKLYFTRENDSSHLKRTISLDVNILNAIKIENNLSDWPNPIMLRLDDIDDLSVFAIRGHLTISFKE